MVRAIRTPSSSSSAGRGGVRWEGTGRTGARRTDVDRFDPDTLLDVGGIRVVRDLVGKDLGLAKGVDKSCAASSRGTWVEGEVREVKRERGRKKDEPTTMSVN